MSRRLHKFGFIVAPYERTTSFLRGAAAGPEALLREWRRLHRREGIPEPAVLVRLPATALRGPRTLLPALGRAVSLLVGLRLLPVLLGGEHTVTLGAVRAWSRTRGGFGVVQLDAHADLRGRYLGSRYSHACTMRRLREETNLPLLPIGLRAYSREEAEYLRRHRIGFLPGHRLGEWEKVLPSLLGTFPRQVYLTVDMDFFDPAVVPGVGTPEPGGAGWYEGLDMIDAVLRRSELIGLDLVELCPPKEKARSVRAAARFLEHLLIAPP